MPEFILLPLDDRPCSRLFPAELGKIVDIKVSTPPRGLLGSFTTPGNPEQLAGWLLARAPRATAAIISAEMLCYGGLIASRSPSVPYASAKQRIETLRTLKEALPQLPIYLSSVIMRLSITADSPEKLGYWRDIALYSQLVYRVEQLGQSRWEDALAAIRRRIPEEVLAEYLQARKRNHEINRAAIELVADNTVDSLVLCQEDSAPIGLHVPEKQALFSLIHEKAISKRVFVHPGADEAGLTLLARAACAYADIHPRIFVKYGSADGAQRVALYEDRPIAENVTGHIHASGAAQTKDISECDLALFVHTPIGPQRETARRDSETDRKNRRQARRLAQRALLLKDQGIDIAFADIAYCNGADPQLADELIEPGLFPLLYGYAGWNTAGNTIGTALAQGILRYISKRAGSAEEKRLTRYQLDFLFKRLMDDLLYQSAVRQEANEWVESLGASPLSLGEAKDGAEQLIRGSLTSLMRKIYRSQFENARVGKFCLEGLRQIKVTLPWPRTFEVEVDLRVKLSDCSKT